MVNGIDNRLAEGDEVFVGEERAVVKDGKLVPGEHKPRESSKDKRARLRGTFTPSKPAGYNRAQRQRLAESAVREAHDDLVLAGCDLLEARKSAVNPKRRSVRSMLREVWRRRKETKLAEKHVEASR